MKYELLEKIQSPADLKDLSFVELDRLAEEIRQFLITHVAETGGHLASNLGVVELTIALHRVFSSPEDSIVWDVGHQCYTHKLLTGRQQQFSTLRQEGGLSGYPKPDESLHDCFVAGHSSNSVSAAFAAASANRLLGNSNHAVAVLGDGALTGGQVYEAMNNAGRENVRLIIVLNDNEMSISKNVGALTRYLSSIRSKPGYLQLKRVVEGILEHIPLVGKHAIRTLRSSKSMFKYLLYHDTFFDDMGWEYFGPVDGHNTEELERTLRRAKDLSHPVIVHVESKKGRGYEFAEENPSFYHGVGQFEVATGRFLQPEGEDFSAVFGNALLELAREDERICAVTAAMSAGTGLNAFSKEFPCRFFDVGIAEEHAVTFAAGLAEKGFLPVFAVYSTFLQRAYDQVMIDAARTGQHMVLAVDRAGIVGSDGETHQGVYDISYLTGIPGVTVLSPSNGEELKLALKQALYEETGVVAVRYPRAACEDVAVTGRFSDYSLTKRGETLVISYGRVSREAAAAAAENGASFLKLLKVYPFSQKLLEDISSYRNILFVEEAAQNGSVSEHLSWELNSRGIPAKFRAVTLPNAFIGQGSIPEVLKKYHLDKDSVSDLIKEAFR